MDGIFTEAVAARMDQINAANGLTVTMEAMLNHPVLKKDEVSHLVRCRHGSWQRQARGMHEGRGPSAQATC